MKIRPPTFVVLLSLGVILSASWLLTRSVIVRAQVIEIPDLTNDSCYAVTNQSATTGIYVHMIYDEFDIPIYTFNDNIPAFGTKIYRLADMPIPAGFLGRVVISADVLSSASKTFCSGGSADLAITNSVDNPSPIEGDTIIFTITVNNSGPDQATGIQVFDLLPVGIFYVSDNSGGAYNSRTGVWTVGSLANGVNATLRINASVGPGTAGQNITNSANISTLDQSDPNLGNNTADVVINVVGSIEPEPPSMVPIYPVTHTISSTTMAEGIAHRYYRLQDAELSALPNVTVDFEIDGLYSGQAISDENGLVDITIDSTGLATPPAALVVSVTQLLQDGEPINLTYTPTFTLQIVAQKFETVWQGGGLISGKVGGGVASVAEAYIKGEVGGGIEITLCETDPLIDTDDELRFHRQYAVGAGVGTGFGPKLPSPGPVKLSASAKLELMFKFMRELEMTLNDPYASEQQKAQAALLLATLMDISRSRSPLGMAIMDALIDDEAYLDYLTSKSTAFGVTGTFNTTVGIEVDLPLKGASAPVGFDLLDAEASLGLVYKKTEYVEDNFLGYALEQDGSVSVDTLNLNVSKVKVSLLTYLSVASRVREELFIDQSTGQIDHFELSITGETILLNVDGETTITYIIDGEDVNQTLLDSLRNLAVLQAASQGRLNADLAIGPSAAVQEIENLLNNVPVSAYEVKVGDGADISVRLEDLEFGGGVVVGLGAGVELSTRQNSIVERGGLIYSEQSLPTEIYSPYDGGAGKTIWELLSNTLEGAWLLVQDSFTTTIKTIQSGVNWVVRLFTSDGGALISGNTAIEINRLGETGRIQATTSSTVTIRAVAWTADEFAVGGIYQFSPEETNFSPDATLSITYTQSVAAGLDESKFLIYRWDTINDNWTPLSSNVNTTANVLTTTITQLGTYAIGYDDTSPSITLVLPSADGETIESHYPPITAIITDTDSGINPSAIVMKINDQTVSHQYDPYFHLAWYTPTISLENGDYTLFISTEDMAGNDVSISVYTTINIDFEVYLPLILKNYIPSSQTPTATPTSTPTSTNTPTFTPTPTNTFTPTPTNTPTPSNLPPNTPANPTPVDGATNQGINVDLSWTGGDPDGNSVTYDVYFEVDDSLPDVLLCNDLASTSCDPGMLSYGTHYYWQVIARDLYGLTSTGPVWNFTTSPIVETLIFKVSFEARDNAANKPQNVPIQVKIKNLSGDQVLFETDWVSVTPAAGNNNWGTALVDVSNATLTPGQSYQIFVKGAMHLAKRVTIPITEGLVVDYTDPIVNPDGILWTCDINQDNQVSVADVDIVGSHFGDPVPSDPDPPSEVYRSDQNGDQIIDILDLTLCGQNVGKVGD